MALNIHKLKDLILYLGRSPHVKNLGKTKLWKLIYFVDVAFLRETGKSFTGSEYIKYDHGPVPSRGEKLLKRLDKEGQMRILHKNYRSFSQHHVETTYEGDLPFSSGERDFIDAVCLRYGQKTATFLSEISHEEPAWIHAEKLQKLSPSLMYYGCSEDEEGL